MLATVRGIVTASGIHDVVVEANGMGLLVSVPLDVAASLTVGSEAFLHTVLIPREDEWLLFGFLSLDDKQLFTSLRGVTGVGPRTALAILSQMPAREIAEAVEAGDDSRFRSVPGIGQKTASLIIVSLTGKLPHAAGGDITQLADALTGLGWASTIARDVARDVVRDHPTSALPERIRIALHALGSRP
ncbi:MAG: Holliday junction branch migration protein RuvA [Microbacteriaceae bacterium]|nr:Holliday junction branch migration protein RuvA [Microbacteriaceae bacterium]